MDFCSASRRAYRDDIDKGIQIQRRSKSVGVLRQRDCHLLTTDKVPCALGNQSGLQASQGWKTLASKITQLDIQFLIEKLAAYQGINVHLASSFKTKNVFSLEITVVLID